jgi:hypothetical protein
VEPSWLHRHVIIPPPLSGGILVLGVTLIGPGLYQKR